VFYEAEDGIRDFHVTGVQTCALPISPGRRHRRAAPASSTTAGSTGRSERRRHRGLPPLPADLPSGRERLPESRRRRAVPGHRDGVVGDRQGNVVGTPVPVRGKQGHRALVETSPRPRVVGQEIGLFHLDDQHFDFFLVVLQSPGVDVVEGEPGQNSHRTERALHPDVESVLVGDQHRGREEQLLEAPDQDRTADQHHRPGPDRVTHVERLGIGIEDQITHPPHDPLSPQDVHPDHHRRDGGERRQPRLQRGAVHHERLEQPLVLRRSRRSDRSAAHALTPRSAGRTSATYGREREAINDSTVPPDRSNREMACTTTRPDVSATFTASRKARPVVVVSSRTATFRPGLTGPTRRPPVPWSLSAFRIENASSRPSEWVAVATAMGSAPIVMPPTASASESSTSSTAWATSTDPRPENVVWRASMYQSAMAPEASRNGPSVRREWVRRWSISAWRRGMADEW